MNIVQTCFKSLVESLGMF